MILKRLNYFWSKKEKTELPLSFFSISIVIILKLLSFMLEISILILKISTFILPILNFLVDVLFLWSALNELILSWKYLHLYWKSAYLSLKLSYFSCKLHMFVREILNWKIKIFPVNFYTCLNSSLCVWTELLLVNNEKKIITTIIFCSNDSIPYTILLINDIPPKVRHNIGFDILNV